MIQTHMDNGDFVVDLAHVTKVGKLDRLQEQTLIVDLTFSMWALKGSPRGKSVSDFSFRS